MMTTTRRTMLGLTAGATLAMAAGCDSRNGAGSPAPSTSNNVPPSSVPTYQAYPGVPQPDLPGDGTTGVPNGFLTYADPPLETREGPLGVSKPVEFMFSGQTSATPRERNKWWQKFEADWGTELKVNSVHPSQYLAKFQASIAGRTLAEFTQYRPVPHLPEVLDSMFTDLTPYLAGDEVLKYPAIAAMPTDAWTVATTLGRIYGIPNPRVVAGSVLMTRGDILESMGVDRMPKLSSGEEFLELCRKVTDRSAGQFAIGQSPQDWTIPFLVESLGGPNGWRVEADGTWVHAFETAEFEHALEIATQMWAEGLFHPNTFSDTSAVQSWFESGVTVFFGQNFSNWQGRIATAQYPVGIVQLPKWDGGGLAPKHLGVPAYGQPLGLRKTDDEDRIDELLRVINYIASPFGSVDYLTVNYGVQGRQFDLTNGQVVINPDAPDELIPSIAAYPGGQRQSLLYVPDEQDITRTVHGYCKEVIPAGIKDPSFGLHSETALAKGTTAQRAVNDTIGEIIQKRADMSIWPAAVDKWKTEVGDKLAEEYAAAAQ